MDLTIKEIKEKQKILKKDLTERLNQFKKETGLSVNGKIEYGYISQNYQHWLTLEYPNPFM